MAGFGSFLAKWGSTIVKNLSDIIRGANVWEKIFDEVRSSNNEKKAVDNAMKLIKENQGDINRLMKDRKQMVAVLMGLSVMMERLTEHYGSPGIHHCHTPSSQCCQHATSPPCCHHDHRPREVPGSHHHGSRKRCASHHHDQRGPSDFHYRDQRGSPHRGSCYRNCKEHSGCSSSFHPEFPQCQESSDHKDYAPASSEPPSSWRVCDVCYTSYNMTSRRPTILMCGHTFCRACLEEVALRGSLRCPTCRAYEGRSVAALPSNVFLIATLEKDSPSRAENNRDDDHGKKSSDLLQKEMLRQLAIHLSLESDGEFNYGREGQSPRTASSWGRHGAPEKKMKINKIRVDRGAAVDSTYGSEASSNLQAVEKIRDSFTRIAVDEVLPKVQSIVLCAAEATRHRESLVRVRQEMVRVSERLMLLLEQLDAIVFQDTNTEGRQSRKALVKSIQFVMDVCEGIQEKQTCLMLCRVDCGAAVDSTNGSEASSNLETIQKIKDSFTRMAVDEVLPKVQSIMLFAAEVTRHRESLVRVRQEMVRASERLMRLLEQLDAIAFQDTDTEGRQSRKALVKNIQFVMDVCDGIQEKVKGILL